VPDSLTVVVGDNRGERLVRCRAAEVRQLTVELGRVLLVAAFRGASPSLADDCAYLIVRRRVAVRVRLGDMDLDLRNEIFLILADELEAAAFACCAHAHVPSLIAGERNDDLALLDHNNVAASPFAADHRARRRARGPDTSAVLAILSLQRELIAT
jgi:hypothetical protein